jgi:hypothetical protein
MSILTGTLYDRLAGDAILASYLSIYKGNPAVFTTDPAPGDAALPYIVTAGEAVQIPWDTKNSRGREIIRDVRCYADAGSGSSVTIEAIAERVRYLLHRQTLIIDGFQWVLSSAGGPIQADEQDTYGRIISLSLKAQEI